MSVLANMYVCTPWTDEAIWSSEESLRTPRTGVKDSCEPPRGYRTTRALIDDLKILTWVVRWIHKLLWCVCVSLLVTFSSMNL